MNRHKPAVLLALVVSAVVPVTTASAGVSGSIPPQDTVQAILDDWVAGGSGGVAVGITVRQLLAHRSGLAEHTDGELGPAVLADPTRSWTPQEVLDLVVEQPRDFPPGEQFAYSNTNYIVAGLLLEHVTDMSTADNLRARIVEPLGLTHTYLAPDGVREPIGAFSRSLPGGDTDGASYHALETAAGAAGAVVSSAGDIATFIRALAHGELVPADDLRRDDSRIPHRRGKPRHLPVLSTNGHRDLQLSVVRSMVRAVG